MFLWFNKRKTVIYNQFLKLKNVICNFLIQMIFIFLVMFLECDCLLCLNFQNKSRARKLRSYLWMHLALNVSCQLSIIEFYKKMGSSRFFCSKCVCIILFFSSMTCHFLFAFNFSNLCLNIWVFFTLKSSI
jgi:hypothetical protein